VHKIVEVERDVFFNHVITRALARRNPQSPFLGPSLVPCVDGIAMSIEYFPETPEVVKKKLQGKIEIEMVVFTRAEYGSYSTEIAGRPVEVSLFEAKNDPQLVELATYLKAFRHPRFNIKISARQVNRIH
jgi:hypothetical protein